MEIGHYTDGSAYIHTTSGSSGTASFEFEAFSDTTVSFGAELIAPSGTDDSFYVEMDSGGQETWHTGQSTDWTWQATADKSLEWTVTAGTHTFHIHGREDGTLMATLRIDSGDARF